jgi:2'-5' RNA ligase
LISASEKAKRVIAIFPYVPDTSPIHVLRQRFDPLAALVPPHITLVFPFESELTSEHLREHILQAVADIRTFPVRLANVTGAEGEYLFLNVKQGNDDLIALHDWLYMGPLAGFLSPHHTYAPHMTVGRLTDPAAWREAVLLTAGLDVRHDMIVHEISVYVIQDDGSWRIESVVPL